MPTDLFFKELDKYPKDFLHPYTSNPLPTLGFLYDLCPNAIILADNIYFDTNSYYINYESISHQYYFNSDSDFSKFQLHLKSLYDKYIIARKQVLHYYKLQQINEDF